MKPIEMSGTAHGWLCGDDFGRRWRCSIGILDCLHQVSIAKTENLQESVNRWLQKQYAEQFSKLGFLLEPTPSKKQNKHRKPTKMPSTPRKAASKGSSPALKGNPKP